jgi:hypothetical protein
MAQRQEGQERIVIVQPEILGQNPAPRHRHCINIAP